MVAFRHCNVSVVALLVLVLLGTGGAYGFVIDGAAMSCGNDALNWTPTPGVPEPSVIALLVSGLGTALLGRRANRRNMGI